MLVLDDAVKLTPKTAAVLRRIMDSVSLCIQSKVEDRDVFYLFVLLASAAPELAASMAAGEDMRARVRRVCDAALGVQGIRLDKNDPLLHLLAGVTEATVIISEMKDACLENAPREKKDMDGNAESSSGSPDTSDDCGQGKAIYEDGLFNRLFAKLKPTPVKEGESMGAPQKTENKAR